MQYRTLGKTGLQVSVIGFGGIKLPEVSTDTAAEALNTALDLGINFIDTARSYRDSEAKIGHAVAHRRHEYILATKSYERSSDGVRRELETSLSLLRTSWIDLYQLHSVSSEGEWQRVMAPGGALSGARKAREEGLIRHIGLSVHRDLHTMRKAITCDEFETIMLCYNAVDSENVGPGILPLARESGKGVIIMKALSGGIMVSPGFEEGKRAGEEDPLVALALRFVAANPNVDVVVTGMRNAAEVRQNARIGAAPLALSKTEEATLMRMLGELRATYRYGQMCLQCGYCQPCPQGVQIPQIFRAWRIRESYPAELKGMADEIIRNLEGSPARCEGCGECLKKCPASLDIPRLLKEAAAALQLPFA